MRTKYVDLDADLSVMATGYIEVDELPDCLGMTLAGINTATLTIVSLNGQSRTYHTIEYRCELCDSYEHKVQQCPDVEQLDPNCDHWFRLADQFCARCGGVKPV